MMAMPDAQNPTGAGQLDWLMASFARQVPDVAHAITVSGDGLRLACSADLPVDQADHLSAVISGLASLTFGAARVMQAGQVRQTIVDMDGGVMIVMSVGDRRAARRARRTRLRPRPGRLRDGHAGPPGRRRARPTCPEMRCAVRVSRVLTVALVLLATGGWPRSMTAPRAGADLWHGGRLFIATGNTTGVFYQIGGGYADLITRYLPGYEAHAESSGASGENIKRVATGDFDIGFSNGDTAADAVAGKAPFAGKPQKIVALSRIYRNYVHCIVRTAANINTFADLRGKRVSTSSPNSGTDILAGRILAAGDLDPDKDVLRQRLSLPETTKGMQAGTTDALVFTGGLPTPGISDLLASAPGSTPCCRSTSCSSRLSPVRGGVRRRQAAHRPPTRPRPTSKRSSSATSCWCRRTCPTSWPTT